LKEGQVKKYMLTIVIGGDICPVGSVEKPFMNGNAVETFSALEVKLGKGNIKWCKRE